MFQRFKQIVIKLLKFFSYSVPNSLGNWISVNGITNWNTSEMSTTLYDVLANSKLSFKYIVSCSHS